ncbi:MAG TPA: SLBB domain-containing protein [Pyrinomonadaceae bacterium]|nr:SLBB domain-containing protein [Pyrinomonadaceae bacterium]
MKFSFRLFQSLAGKFAGIVFALLLSACLITEAFPQAVKPPPPAPEQTQNAARVSSAKPSVAELVTEETSDSVKTNLPAAPFVSEDLIHLGDVIDVDILGSLEYDWRGALDSEGFLSSLPYAANPVLALCRTEDELASEIAVAYTKFLRNPQVVVRVVDRSARQQARMFGAIRSPLRLQIERPVHLNELIVLAGGITERASGEIKIFRPAYSSCSETKTVQKQSETSTIKILDLLSGKNFANPLIRTGDIVTIEEAKPIFVTGGVAAPQQVLFRGQITLSRALASAGGFLRDADGTKIVIYRRLPSGGTKIVEADFDKISKKQSEDLALEPFDIVEVPQIGRTRNNRPPTLNGWENPEQNQLNLPLRIIN